MRIIEREEPKCIKFETVNSPIHLNLWIQLLPTSETACKMKLTVGADLNPFIKGMVAKPLKEGVEKLADMLAMIHTELNHTKTIWQANFGKKIRKSIKK